MMTHKLRILVLKHLAGGPRSGYRIIKEIKEATGWKPSYGSVYPLLEQLKKEGLTTAKEQGKSNLYTLTAKGRTELRLFTEHHDALVQQVHEWQKVMAHLCGAEREPFFEHIASSLERGDVPFKEILESKSSRLFRTELARLSQAGLLKERRAEVVAIIDEATRKLRGIRAGGEAGGRAMENVKRKLLRA